MSFLGNKPNISFREFKSYGPHDLDEILSEARTKVSSEDKVKVSPYGSTPEQHQSEHARREKDHNEAADALESASRNVHPDHAKDLKRLAKLHREAAKAHGKAKESWSSYNSSQKNRRDNKATAKAASESATTSTNIASSPHAFSKKDSQQIEASKKPGFIESFKIMRKGKADIHRSAAIDHEAAHKSLKKAAGLATAPEHSERLSAMSEAHKNAAKAHLEAAKAHDEYHASGLAGSGSKHRAAVSKTTNAEHLTRIANEQ